MPPSTWSGCRTWYQSRRDAQFVAASDSPRLRQSAGNRHQRLSMVAESLGHLPPELFQQPANGRRQPPRRHAGCSCGCSSRSEPVACADRLVLGELGHQPLQLPDQAPDCPPIPAWKLGGIDEHESVMRSAPLVGRVGNRHEVCDIFGDHRSAIRLGLSENRGICESAKLLSLGNRNHVATAPAKLLHHCGWIHLIDE